MNEQEQFLFDRVNAEHGGVECSRTNEVYMSIVNDFLAKFPGRLEDFSDNLNTRTRVNAVLRRLANNGHLVQIADKRKPAKFFGVK